MEIHNETIPIVTDKRKFFLQYLILKRPVIDMILTKVHRKKTRLSDKPMEVLAELLYWHDYYQELEEAEKWKKVFSRETRDEIQRSLNLKEHYLNNYISQLRALKIIEGKSIRPPFLIYAKNMSLNFKFTFNENGHQ